ncbi:MAG: hypothetical protein HQL42_11015 [Alphaproteobacteria bacterium]|nr:hypothetical protein [Alphaproteobacteria bacterium]
MGRMSPPRLPLLLMGAICLLTGMVAGLGRLGFAIPDMIGIHQHGPLMVCGFFGTVIGLERAVALQRPWTFAAPFATGGGGLLMLAGQEVPGAVMLTLGSWVFLAGAISVVRRQPEPFTRLMALAALLWGVGNLLWLAGSPVAEIVPLWASFLVLTIAGERLELSRFLPPSRLRLPTMVVPVALIGSAAAASAMGWGQAWLLFGLGLVALVVWSAINDVIRRTIRQTGLTRYVAICLASGYGWLAVAGMLFPALADGLATPFYDAALHALFVGFVFAMVFGHAPVILPAVLKVRLPFKPYFYVPLALLHGSLLARLAGDFTANEALRMAGGLANVAAILIFMVTVVATILLARNQ